MEGGQINHNWCMGVVSHSYGGLGWGREVMVCRTKQGVVGRHRVVS